LGPPLKKRPKNDLNWGLGSSGRAASGAAARHSQYARIYTEFVKKNTLFLFFWVQPGQACSPNDLSRTGKNKQSKMRVQPAELKNGQKTPETDFGVKKVPSEKKLGSAS